MNVTEDVSDNHNFDEPSLSQVISGEHDLEAEDDVLACPRCERNRCVCQADPKTFLAVIRTDSDDSDTIVIQRTALGVHAEIWHQGLDFNSANGGGSVMPLRHVCRHSPTGFEFGYGGSGPADLALSMLSAAVVKSVADEYYQAFKAAAVARATGQRWQMTIGQIRQWVLAAHQQGVL